MILQCQYMYTIREKMFTEIDELGSSYYNTQMGNSPVDIIEEQYYNFLKIVSKYVHEIYTTILRNRTDIGQSSFL